jgi:hypothetical protein
MAELGLDLLDWQTVAVAVAAALACALLVRRSASRWRSAITRTIVFVAALVAVVGYFLTAADRDLAADRRALQAREADLAARAVMPGSALGCLNGVANEAVETACEKAVFAKPETAAAAVAYVTAQLDVLADAVRLIGVDDEDFGPALAGLRRSIALDRYGVVAHALATREGCTAESCWAFALVDDPSVLKANLKGRAFNTYVERYQAAWNKPEEPAKPSPEGPQANAAPAQPSTSFASRYDFPSAASIPPVSIMNPEPPRPAEPNAAATPAASAAEQPAAPEHTPVPPNRPQTQGAATR